jgi:hypothetical protein
MARMTRPEVNELAKTRGLDPEEFGSKEELIDALAEAEKKRTKG